MVITSVQFEGRVGAISEEMQFPDDDACPISIDPSAP
jgi:hypothetical protein